MTTELEDTLARELHEVAAGVPVPPIPSLPSDQPRSRVARLWQPLLVAAVVALIVGGVALVLSQQGDDSPQPMPAPSVTTGPTGSPNGSGTTIAVTEPTVPYVFDQRLYVDGGQVPGSWWYVESREGVWVAQQTDGSWWWGGPGVAAGLIDSQVDQGPVISPNGHFVAYVASIGGRAMVNGFTTSPGGEGFGPPPATPPATEDGIAVRVRAVTDDGQVILQGTRTSLMWPTVYDGEQTVADLTETAPDQVVLQGTSAGLVVVDGSDGATDATDTEPYLATMTSDGRLTATGTLPTYDTLDISPGGSWLVRSPAGTLGGEVTSVTSLRAQPVGSTDEVTLDAPDGWGFATGSWQWEDDETLVADLLPADGTERAGERLVRCNVVLGACRGFAGPTVDGTRSWGAEETLDAVIQAVVEDDRAGLLDQAVIGDGEWDQLVGFAAGQDGAGGACRDNGEGTRDCDIRFAADDSIDYYAILKPAENAYGWRITYVGIGGA